MEIDSNKQEYYKNKNEVKRNQIKAQQYFKNKIGKQRRNSLWN